MNQADVSKAVSQIKFFVKSKPARVKSQDLQGNRGRLDKLRKTVTALFKYERIELNYNRANEARGYAERLISDAIRYGDCHNKTMRMADFWLEEKQLIHKLFKVLVPRYQNYNVSCTRMIAIPRPYPGYLTPKSVLELRGNPYPPLVTFSNTDNRNLLHNVLLEEARKEKYLEMAQTLGQDASSSPWVANALEDTAKPATDKPEV